MAKTFDKCATKFCRGRASQKLYHSPYCSKCRSRRWREAHPITAAFTALRHSAAKRGHKFTITLEYFEEFWKANDFDSKRGKTAGSLTVDRKDNDRGYEPGNLQALTLSENSRKQFVPYWKNQADKERLIKEAEAEVKRAYQL